MQIKHIAIASIIVLLSATSEGQKLSTRDITDKQVADVEVRMEASLYVAKRVCADNPGVKVWIFEGAWALVPCDKLKPVFDQDGDNLFEAIGQLRDEVLHSRLGAK